MSLNAYTLNIVNSFNNELTKIYSTTTGVSLKPLTQGQSTTIKFLAKADSQPSNNYIIILLLL